MWIVAWESPTGPTQAEAPSEAAAESRVRALAASGITRVTFFEMTSEEI